MDSSIYDEICINCGATDIPMGGWGELAKPCTKPVGKGGMTRKQWNEQERERVREAPEK